MVSLEFSSFSRPTPRFGACVASLLVGMFFVMGTALTADNITDPVADADEFLNQGDWVIK